MGAMAGTLVGSCVRVGVVVVGRDRGERHEGRTTSAYDEALRMQEVPEPEVTRPLDVVRIGGAGLCRTTCIS